MKRVFKRRQEPALLAAYRDRHPQEIWENFRRRCHRGYAQVKQAILEDQCGLCAYCEIGIKQARHDNEVDDFRVEHFYPKGYGNNAGHNYHLDWQNMLGVCHGGSQPGVPDADWRFSSSKRDRSCDVPKGGREITASILNPLELPAEVRLFRYAEHTGGMAVDLESCPKNLQDRAANTIKELNLNAPRLMRMRLVVINELRKELEGMLLAGVGFEQAMGTLAQSLLAPDDEGRRVPFFTVVRWYLGASAEKFLAGTHYKM